MSKQQQEELQRQKQIEEERLKKQKEAEEKDAWAMGKGFINLSNLKETLDDGKPSFLQGKTAQSSVPLNQKPEFNPN